MAAVPGRLSVVAALGFALDTVSVHLGRFIVTAAVFCATTILAVVAALAAAAWFTAVTIHAILLGLGEWIAVMIAVPTVIATLTTIPFHFLWQRLALCELSVAVAASRRPVLLARFARATFGLAGAGLLLVILSTRITIVRDSWAIVWIGCALGVYVVARLCLVLPAAACGDAIFWHTAWTRTRGQGLRLTALIAIALLPLGVADSVLFFFAGGTEMDLLGMLLVHLAGYFLSSAILSGGLAFAFASLVPATTEPRPPIQSSLHRHGPMTRLDGVVGVVGSGVRLRPGRAILEACRIVSRRPAIFLTAATLLVLIVGDAAVIVGLLGLYGIVAIGRLAAGLNLDLEPLLELGDRLMDGVPFAALVLAVPVGLVVFLTLPFHFLWQRVSFAALGVPRTPRSAFAACLLFMWRHLHFAALGIAIALIALVIVALDPHLRSILPTMLAAACLAGYLIARLSLVLPATAIGHKAWWRDAWRSTRAQGIRIAVLIALAMLPVMAADGMLALAMIGRTCGRDSSTNLAYLCSLGEALSAAYDWHITGVLRVGFASHLLGYALSSAILSSGLAIAYAALVLDRAVDAPLSAASRAMRDEGQSPAQAGES